MNRDELLTKIALLRDDAIKLERDLHSAAAASISDPRLHGDLHRAHALVRDLISSLAMPVPA